jgi:hypothetical protein
MNHCLIEARVERDLPHYFYASFLCKGLVGLFFSSGLRANLLIHTLAEVLKREKILARRTGFFKAKLIDDEVKHSKRVDKQKWRYL